MRPEDSSTRVTLICPKCLRPVVLWARVHVMADYSVVVDRDRVQAGMVIHVTKGCVAR